MHTIHNAPHMDFRFHSPSLLALIAGLRQHDNAFKHTSNLQDQA
jgi:hypothetical protein